MQWLDMIAIVAGILSANLGAVLVSRVNLGLFANSILGALGAGATILMPAPLHGAIAGHWVLALAAASIAGLVITLLVGVLNELRFRN